MSNENSFIAGIFVGTIAMAIIMSLILKGKSGPDIWNQAIERGYAEKYITDKDTVDFRWKEHIKN